MRGFHGVRRLRAAGATVLLGMVFQFGGCNLGEITTTSTVDVRELLVSVVRGAILVPLDEFVTGSINNAFGGGN